MNSAELASWLFRRSLAMSSLLLLIAPSSQAPAQSASSPTTPDFTSFRIITERNIFNASRSGTSAPTVDRTPGPKPREDNFTLVGTLGDGQQWTAFFDGSRSELRGRLRRNETIAGYTLTQITNSGVQLENGTNTVQLRVGTQLRREDDGPWLLAEHPTLRKDTSSRQKPATESSTASASTGGTDNDVLLRLKQKREKELQ